MFSVLRDPLPEYRNNLDLSENFDRFFEWALGLKKPKKVIIDTAQEKGYATRVHPIGFMVVYLSGQDSGMLTPGVGGVVRANLFPEGGEISEDIHSHGFDFHSGIISGSLTNTLHFPNWNNPILDGSGYIGYESLVDFHGVNHTTKATDPVIRIETNEELHLERGERYSMRPRIDFHSVSTSGDGALTIFCKTPTYEGSDGLALVLKKSGESGPPEEY